MDTILPTLTSRTARLLTAVLCGIAALPACGPDDADRPAPPPPRATPLLQVEPADERTPRHVEEATPAPTEPLTVDETDPWQPPPDLVLRARELLNGNDAAVDGRLGKLPAGERVELLRAGLRLPDAEAMAAAARLEYAETDNWESARAVSLLHAEVLRLGTRSSFEDFRGMIGGRELDTFFERLPPGEWEYAEDVIGQLHRSATGDNVPALARLAASPRARLAAQAIDDLGLLVRYTDRHRDEVAVALLGAEALAGLAPSTEVPAGSGLSPRLRAALGLLLTQDALPRFPEHDLQKSGFVDWVLRWLIDSDPADTDGAFLVELYRGSKALSVDDSLDWQRALARERLVQSMAHVADRDSLALLESLRRGREDVHTLARYALAVRGDATARAALTAQRDPLALALRVDAFPGEEIAGLRTLIADGGAPARASLETLRTAVHETRRMYGLAWKNAKFEDLRGAFADGSVAADVYLEAALSIPRCNTREIAQAWFSRVPLAARWSRISALGADDSEGESDGPSIGPADVLGWLETADPQALRETLRTAAPQDDAAMWQLMRLGDPDHATELVAWFDRRDPQASPRVLARTRAPAVIEYLRGKVAGGGQADPSAWRAALARAYGIHHEPAESIFGENVAKDVLDALLAGRPADAVAATLAAEPDRPFWGVGFVDDPRVTAYLRRLQTERRLHLYAWATAQLAIQGDAAAREETRAVFEIGRYRWIDEQGATEYTFGGQPAAARMWIDQQESNCCRVASTDSVFEDLFGVGRQVWGWGESGTGETYYRSYLRWWEETGGEFVWSNLLQRYLPAR